MALVTVTALSMALILFLFKVFDKRGVPLMPAIAINYITACTLGVIFAQPWKTGIPVELVVPVSGLGVLFIVLFYLTAVSTRRAGVAATSVASKMSLVLTVLFAVIFFHERPSPMGWTGIAIAFVAVPLASYARGAPGAKGVWLLPLLLFLGNAAIDISINAMQRSLLDEVTEPLFLALVFAVAGALGCVLLLIQGEGASLFGTKALIGGIVLGSINYASLSLLVATLARSGIASSSVFPLLNIGVILFSTAMSLLAFSDRLRKAQWFGIALAVAAMLLLISA